MGKRSGGEERSVLAELDELTVKLRLVERVRGSDREQLKQRLGWTHTLIAVTGGSVLLELERKQLALVRGSVYWCEPASTYGFEPKDGEFELILLHFDLYRLSEPAEGSAPAAERMDACLLAERLMAVEPERLEPLCGRIWQGWNGAGRPGVFRCQIDVQELIWELVGEPAPKPVNTAAALEYARRYIEEHYMEPLTIERLAQIAGVSPKYFVDLYKKRFGVSAMEQMTELRLHQAKRLMLESRLRLRDIAHRVGYADEFYFSRKFKKEIGVSPSDNMKQSGRRLGVYSSELLGMLLPLHVMPYAAPLHPKWTDHYYRELRDSIPVHLSANRYLRPWQDNIELLRQASVDRILASDEASEQEREALERIAPVDYVPTAGGNWREALGQLAGLLGEEWQAKRWLEEYDRIVREGRELVQAAVGQESVAVVRVSRGRLSLSCNPGMRDVLYDGLGLTPAYRSADPLYDVPVTPEELAALQPDRLLFLVRYDNETLTGWRRLQEAPRWQRIGAVREQRTGLLPSDPWRENSAHARLRMLEQAVRLLAGENPFGIRILSMVSAPPLR